jgi:uncharacterized protein
MINKNLTIILKVAEICPLACDYCYFFRGQSAAYKNHPNIIQKDVLYSICKIINDYDSIDKISNTTINFHGGEPLMVGYEYIEELCCILKENMKTPYDLYLQTNGVLLNERWIELLKKYQIKCGVSIDGPEEYQNLRRKFKDGRGTFDIVDKNIRLCLNNGLEIGALMVLGESYDPQRIYDYVVKNLGIKNIDVLLPDYTHDTSPVNGVDSFSDCICGLFSAWVNHDDPTVKIRMFSSLLDLMMGGEHSILMYFNKVKGSLPVLSISTSGDVTPADELLSLGDDFMYTGTNVLTNDLQEIFAHSVFSKIDKAYETLPNECSDCCWKNICNGGIILQRYSKKNEFNNKSVYCYVLRKLFSTVASYLLKNGHDKTKLLQVLSGKA